MIRVCEFCGKPFNPKIRNKRFCSKECSDKFYKKDNSNEVLD